MKKIKEIARQVAKYYSYAKPSMSFIKDNCGQTVESFVLLSMSDPQKAGLPSNISAAFLDTEDGLKVVHFFMRNTHIFGVAPEEIEKYPQDYKIYQDGTFAYITTDVPEDISITAKLFKVFNSFDAIFLSERSRCQYEKVADYVNAYLSVGELIDECVARGEEQKYVDYFIGEHTYEKQIIIPFAKAAANLLGKANYVYNQTCNPQGDFVVLRFSSPNEQTETGICLLISELDGMVSVKKATGRNPDGSYTTVDLPECMCDVIGMMQTKPKVANKS